MLTRCKKGRNGKESPAVAELYWGSPTWSRRFKIYTDGIGLLRTGTSSEITRGQVRVKTTRQHNGDVQTADVAKVTGWTAAAEGRELQKHQ